ncbi:transposase domain-containing protein [Mycolicibacterium baixiangningiae]|uniref:transposase domain-containing protein n=1 Tax=Mycolicibacterium baixiangningiae TaxID=2761578 RepID=UPI0018690F68|nr:transposase domain-containing protein [Mycolicibacterium baixiangningiae]
MSALVAAAPTTMVDEVLGAAGVAAERVRSLPPWVTIYHVLGSAMSPLANYDEVTDLLWTTLPAATGRGLSRQRPTRGAITRARSRLGTEPLTLLLRQTLRAVSEVGAKTDVELHRFEPPGTPGLWWVSEPGTGALRGCDVRGAGLDIAEALLRSTAVTHVTVDLPEAAVAALQQRMAPDVHVVAGLQSATTETPWLGLRARTRAAWEQDALARACVCVALERALAIARQDPF